MSEPWFQHTGCDHCRHVMTNVIDIDVTLRVRYPRHMAPPTREEMALQLADALPKEWWWGDNMADWGLEAIR